MDKRKLNWNKIKNVVITILLILLIIWILDSLSNLKSNDKVSCFNDAMLDTHGNFGDCLGWAYYPNENIEEFRNCVSGVFSRMPGKRADCNNLG